MKNQKARKRDYSTLQARLGLCAAALAGTAAAVPSADATIITFTTPYAAPPPGFTGVVPPTFAGVYINLATGLTGSTQGTTAGWDFNPYLSGTQLNFFWATGGAGVAAAAAGPYVSLSVGAVVGPASTYSTSASATTGSPYLTSGTHILGFHFLNGATTNYGYMTMTNTGGGANSGFPTTILSWSYDDTGAAITVVPEPATAALLSIGALVLGALGLREWRRQHAA